MHLHVRSTPACTLCTAVHVAARGALVQGGCQLDVAAGCQPARTLTGAHKIRLKTHGPDCENNLAIKQFVRMHVPPPLSAMHTTGPTE
jgi:hypothetical protein